MFGRVVSWYKYNNLFKGVNKLSKQQQDKQQQDKQQQDKQQEDKQQFNLAVAAS